MRYELRKIEYKIEKVKDEPKKWMIIRYSETKRGCSIGKIFEGSRQECIDKIKEMK